MLPGTIKSFDGRLLGFEDTGRLTKSSGLAHSRRTMNHRSKNTLSRIFQHPQATDIEWSRIETLFHALGATVEHTSTNHIKVQLPNGPEASFSPPSHGHQAGRELIMQVRHYLESVGVTPDHPEYSDPGTSLSAAPGTQIIIHLTHHESSIYTVAPGESDGIAVKPYDPWHHRHHLDHKLENTFEGQRAPEVPSYFDDLASHVRGASEFLLVGHGAGNSDMRTIFLKYLRSHHRDLLGRLAGVITVDEHVTVPQLLAFANEYFGVAALRS